MGIKLAKGGAEDRGYIIGKNTHVTFRELQILLLVARGLEHQEIAERFGIRINTVRNHVYNLMVKLGANNRTQAIIRAIENGMFQVTRDKGLVGWSPDDFFWCWKCARVFTVDETVRSEPEKIEVNHVWIETPLDDLCPYCNNNFDKDCDWEWLLRYNPDLPKIPDRNTVYPNLDYVPYAEEVMKDYYERKED